MAKTFTVSSTPHVRSKESINSIMRDVFIALLPATVVGIINSGALMPNAIVITLVSIFACIFFEFMWQKLRHEKITISDMSAAVTGLLLAMNMPASAPVWMPIVGAGFAILICKQLFGGLGQNFINPALAGRAFLLASYPTLMTNWAGTKFYDAVSAATPLAQLKTGVSAMTYTTMDAFLGRVPGALGEVCALALIIGGVYLLAKKIISWRIPVIYIAVVFVLTAALGRTGGRVPVYEICSGGLMLGAFFMATDYVTSPVTPKGQMLFAVGCGVLTAFIRKWGGYPEGVSYSILIMNLLVPLIDKNTRPKIFGEVKKA